MKVTQIFSMSVKEMRKLSCIAICGLLIALRIAIGFLAIPIGNYNRIDFSYIPVALSGYMFGPVLGGFVGGLSDILTLIFKPSGMLNPIITLSKTVSGVIYGLLLYKQTLSIKRTTVTCIFNFLISDIGLTTLGLCTIGGSIFSFIFPIRLLTYTLLLPLNIAVIYFTLKLADKSINRLI